MYIYWIHLPEHTNILTEGYVGISKNPTNRLKSHKFRSNNPHLLNCFNKYPNVVMDIVLEAEESYCLELEEKLRPDKNIGWNIAKGGGKPPVLTGHKHNVGKIPWNKGIKTGPICEEVKRIRYANLRKPTSAYQKQKASESLKGVKKVSVTCPHCGKSGGKPAMKRFHFDNCKNLT